MRWVATFDEILSVFSIEKLAPLFDVRQGPPYSSWSPGYKPWRTGHEMIKCISVTISQLHCTGVTKLLALDALLRECVTFILLFSPGCQT